MQKPKSSSEKIRFQWKNFRETDSASCWKLQVVEPLWAAADASTLQDKTKENYCLPRGKRHKRQRRFHARMARCCLEPGRVTCKKAMCWAGLKVLTFAGTFFTTGTSNVGQPAREVTPSTQWPLGKAMVVVAFHFSPVSWRYLGTAAVYKPANLTREIGQECSKCFSASPSSAQCVSSEENKLGAIDITGLKWWLLCHFPR